MNKVLKITNKDQAYRDQWNYKTKPWFLLGGRCSNTGSDTLYNKKMHVNSAGHSKDEKNRKEGGDSLTFGTGVLNVLIWGLPFGIGEIIWGLKFRGPKYAICGLKFGVGKITWSPIFLLCHCLSHFLSIKLVFETGQLIIWGF